MDGARAIFCKHLKVEPRAVAFVAIEAIHRIFLVKSEHESVARDFGNDGSRHALEDGGIRLYDGSLGNR